MSKEIINLAKTEKGKDIKVIYGNVKYLKNGKETPYAQLTIDEQNKVDIESDTFSEGWATLHETGKYSFVKASANVEVRYEVKEIVE